MYIPWSTGRSPGFDPPRLRVYADDPRLFQLLGPEVFVPCQFRLQARPKPFTDSKIGSCMQPPTIELLGIQPPQISAGEEELRGDTA